MGNVLLSSPTSTSVFHVLSQLPNIVFLIWPDTFTRPLLPSRSLLPRRWMPCRLVVVFMFPWSWSLQLPVSLAALRLRKATASSTLTDLAGDGDCSFILWFFFFYFLFFLSELVKCSLCIISSLSLTLQFSVNYSHYREGRNICYICVAYLNTGCKYFQSSMTHSAFNTYFKLNASNMFFNLNLNPSLY